MFHELPARESLHSTKERASAECPQGTQGSDLKTQGIQMLLIGRGPEEAVATVWCIPGL